MYQNALLAEVPKTQACFIVTKGAGEQHAMCTVIAPKPREGGDDGPFAPGKCMGMDGNKLSYLC